MDSKERKYDTVAALLTETRYIDLFQRANYNLVDSFWQDGKNKDILIDIVAKDKYNDYARLLASEILFLKQKDYPKKNMEDALAYVYAKALSTSGENSQYNLTGNLWGFMYYTDNLGVSDNGILGNHLLVAKQKAVPHLRKMLIDTNVIVYEGSKEATVGNSLSYRVKDAAAYYIGKITGITVQFHENYADRDAAIETLKDALLKYPVQNIGKTIEDTSKKLILIAKANKGVGIGYGTVFIARVTKVVQGEFRDTLIDILIAADKNDSLASFLDVQAEKGKEFEIGCSTKDEDRTISLMQKNHLKDSKGVVWYIKYLKKLD